MMPSFDIVSEIEMAEVTNAIAGVVREITQRFDFKGTACEISLNDSIITILADDEMRLKQIQELLITYFTRRHLDPKSLDFKDEEQASGQKLKQEILIKQGIDRDLAKILTKEIKESKLKVQASIQGDEVRVTGKKRDDLQEAIAMIKTLTIDRPVQFTNFRD
jgi:uncharacterized protein YajQ (UPF0234 family)